MRAPPPCAGIISLVWLSGTLACIIARANGMRDVTCVGGWGWVGVGEGVGVGEMCVRVGVWVCACECECGCVHILV